LFETVKHYNLKQNWTRQEMNIKMNIFFDGTTETETVQI